MEYLWHPYYMVQTHLIVLCAFFTELMSASDSSYVVLCSIPMFLDGMNSILLVCNLLGTSIVTLLFHAPNTNSFVIPFLCLSSYSLSQSLLLSSSVLLFSSSSFLPKPNLHTHYTYTQSIPLLLQTLHYYKNTKTTTATTNKTVMLSN